MAVLQKSVGSSLLGTLAASCLLLVVLCVQEATALPRTSHCRVKESTFETPYITNYTFMLSSEASLEDNNTDVRLFDDKLFQGIDKKQERCYLMKQVLNFTLEVALLPNSDKFQPYMKQVLDFLLKYSNQLSPCHIKGNVQHIQKNVENLKDTMKKLGESGEIKAIGELDLLLNYLRKACI